MEIKELVKKALEKEVEIKWLTKELDSIKAKIQTYAIEEMENKNIKYLEVYSENGSVSSYYKEKFEVDNVACLKELMGDNLVGKLVIEQKETVKLDSKVKEALIAIYKGDYSKGSVADIVNEFNIDDKSKKLLIKKLKGEYQKDIKLLRDLGLDGAFEEEMDAIHDVKNYELVTKFFESPESVDLRLLKRAVSIESILALGLNHLE